VAESTTYTIERLVTITASYFGEVSDYLLASDGYLMPLRVFSGIVEKFLISF
jgi:hypothetical protein